MDIKDKRDILGNIVSFLGGFIFGFLDVWTLLVIFMIIIVYREYYQMISNNKKYGTPLIFEYADCLRYSGIAILGYLVGWII